jgi:hypothetical protein
LRLWRNALRWPAVATGVAGRVATARSPAAAAAAAAAAALLPAALLRFALVAG